MRRFWRLLTVLGLIAGLTPTLLVQVAVADDAVVGMGTPASCTQGAFDTALATAHLNGGGTITFNCGGPATIDITNIKTIITPNAITIDGANEITLDAAGSAAGIFFVQNAATLNLIGLTLQNSTKTGSGGAIHSAGGIVSIVESTVRDNDATGGGAVGGAIFIAGGTVSIDRSTFNGNTAPESGGAIFNSGGTLTITQSTFQGNGSTLASGGAVGQNAGSTTVTSATVSGNSAGGTGGGFASLGGSISFEGSIVAGNTAAGFGDNCSSLGGALSSTGSNLSNDATCFFLAGTDIQNSTNINLGPLQDNGGPTATMLPGAGSDAIDNAASCPSTDQRGLPRPQGDGCEIGSVELQGSTFTLCVDRYTGRVISPSTNQCTPPNQIEIETPGDYPLTFCISRASKALHHFFNRPCPTNFMTHIVPDNGELLTCVNRATGHHRAVRDHSQCVATERLNTIPTG